MQAKDSEAQRQRQELKRVCVAHTAREKALQKQLELERDAMQVCVWVTRAEPPLDQGAFVSFGIWAKRPHGTLRWYRDRVNPAGRRCLLSFMFISNEEAMFAPTLRIKL